MQSWLLEANAFHRETNTACNEANKQERLSPGVSTLQSVDAVANEACALGVLAVSAVTIGLVGIGRVKIKN